MNVAIIYESLTGNTKEIAEEIKNACQTKHSVIFLSAQEALKEPIHQQHIDLYFLGTWTNKGECGDLMKKFVKRLKHATVALFQTAGYGNSTQYFQSLEKRFISSLPENTKVMGTFYCQGKMPIQVRTKIEALFRANPQDAKLELNLKNFDSAKNHPDKHDLANAKLFAQTVLHQFER